MSIVQVNHLTLGYERIPVIEDVHFSLDKGDFLTVLGSNGSGKSTLVKGLLGLIKPLSGDITYEIDRRFIGYMPQETSVDDFFPASVYEIVLSGTLNRLDRHIFYTRQEKQIAVKAMKRLSIYELRHHPYSQLSGGQRQKVLLARALAATSSLLILDEPSNNLDAQSRKDFYAMIQDLNTKEKLTIIMITHDVGLSGLMGNKVLAFDDERIFFGSKEMYLKGGEGV